MNPGAKSPASILGARLAICHDPPAPPETAWIIFFTSRPIFSAIAIASQTPASVTLTAIWLQACMRR